MSNVVDDERHGAGRRTFCPITGVLGAASTVRHTPAGGSSRPYVQADFPLLEHPVDVVGWLRGHRRPGHPRAAQLQRRHREDADRRIWVRFRDNTGALSAKYGSGVRIMSAIGTSACTAADSSYVGPQPARCSSCRRSSRSAASPSRAARRTPSSRRATPVTFKFAGRRSRAATGFTGVNWRIRNAVTGAMFTRTADGGWAACPAPCNADGLFTVANGAKLSWPADNDVIHRITDVAAPVARPLDRRGRAAGHRRGRHVLQLHRRRRGQLRRPPPTADVSVQHAAPARRTRRSPSPRPASPTRSTRSACSTRRAAAGPTSSGTSTATRRTAPATTASRVA